MGFETFDIDLVALIVDGIPYNDLATGTVITIAYTNTAVSLTTGLKGSGGWSKNRMKNGKITVSLLGSSPENTQLAALLNSEKQFEVMVKDNSGTSLALSKYTRIEKMPDKTYAGAVEATTWEFLCGKLESITGGNL